MKILKFNESVDTIIDHVWKNGRNVIGIVAVRTSQGWIAYIGVGEGRDEKQDLNFIADYGSKLLEDEGRAFFPRLKSLEYDIDA